MVRFLICFLVVAHVTTALHSQSFRGGLIGGINASQINGDAHAGFDKVGLHLGLKVNKELRQKSDLSVELLYSERGSTADRNFGDPFTISVNYVEMPVLVALKDWMKDDFYKMHFEFGGSVGRIIKSQVSDITGKQPLDGLNETDFSAIVGATVYQSPKFGFSFRYTHSLNLLRGNTPNLNRYRGYFLTLRGILFLS